MTDAPDWAPGIPSGTERLAPAWNLIYAQLPDVLWFKATDVADTYAPQTGLARSTITSMIRRAQQAGILERRRYGTRKRVRWEYRRRTTT